MNRRLRVLSLTLVVLTSVLATSLLRAEAPAAVSGSAALGKAAPELSLTDTDGEAVTLSSLRGKTVVLESAAARTHAALRLHRQVQR